MGTPATRLVTIAKGRRKLVEVLFLWSLAVYLTSELLLFMAGL